MQWLVKWFNTNTGRIEDYDIIYSEIKTIKELKKNSPDRETFKEQLRRHLLWRYWCRCEYELIISIKNGRIYLLPWISRDPEAAKIDVTTAKNENGFSWEAFAANYIKEGDDSAKIDIFDQLDFMLDALVDYCWYHRFAYERRQEKFER